MKGLRAVVAAVALLGAKVAPAGAQTPGQAPEPPPRVAAAIGEAAAVWGVNPARLRCLAYRESTYDPSVTSRSGYAGLFQFGWPLWDRGMREARNPADPRYPLLPAGSSPYEARAAALMTGYFLARGETGHWPPLARCPR